MKFTSCISAALLAIGAAAEDPWTNPDGGNTHVDIGNKKVAYGYTPPWYAFDKIKEECPSNGCNSENKIEYATGGIQNGEMRPAIITLAVEGSFNGVGEQGSRDDMVEIVKAVSGASQYDFEQGVSYYVGNGCAVWGLFPVLVRLDSRELAGKKEYADQYTATDLIVVRVENEDGGLLADMSVSIKVDVDDGGEGVCDTITSVGGAIAGAINGLAGGVFSLAALACA
ncbi:hypothetical protein B0J15DRAFT_560845 [Fusarium solani]|uniref:Uncharacterized protein n=1 Tax=Fusarium solani TaxID=169388 RepID=A0A9P9H3D3_FUSSL|nr:uncharacterized protein B0J15DRAFT_560845 [Fusarium solani]KAH7250383.1 hypothetical protein B0J15DRAFT_560845 [Fusarium solani]